MSVATATLAHVVSIQTEQSVPPKPIAESIRLFRAVHRWNQSELAALLGVSRDRVARLEAGHPIRPAELQRLGTLLDRRACSVANPTMTEDDDVVTDVVATQPSLHQTGPEATLPAAVSGAIVAALTEAI